MVIRIDSFSTKRIRPLLFIDIRNGLALSFQYFPLVRFIILYFLQIFKCFKAISKVLYIYPTIICIFINPTIAPMFVLSIRADRAAIVA